MNIDKEYMQLVNQIANKIEIFKELNVPIIQENKEIVFDRLCKKIKNCKKCSLCEFGNNISQKECNLNAKLFFVGEFIDTHEAKKNELLIKIIEIMKLKLDEVYISNVLKCLVPQKYIPKKEEIESCAEFLYKEIEIVKPKVICTLGNISAKFFLNEDEILRGKIYNYRNIQLVPTLKISDCIDNIENKKLLWEDIQKVMKMVTVQQN